jgi:hypothetical protein
MKNRNPFMRLFASFVLVAFVTTSVVPPSFAQAINLPAPGTMLALSPAFTPAHLIGVTIDPTNALKFDFLIHKGEVPLTDDQKREEYRELIKYFLAALAVPNDDQWVNLSPYEGNRMIKDNFGMTEMGRDLLSQDYILKQLTASLMHPDSELGKQFWNQIYEKTYEKYGTTDIPVDTFNKVWIVPDDVSVYEKDNTALIVNSHLKVMTERDYVSMENNAVAREQGGQDKNPQLDDSTRMSSEIVKEIIVPALEREVNEGKNFANLRQIYGGMILATWFKKSLKESILGKAYADRSRTKGINQDPKNNEEIYQQYLAAFKKGVFNMIREDVDQYSQEMIPRKYFSGGVRAPEIVDNATASQAVKANGADLVQGKVDRASTVLLDAAMATKTQQAYNARRYLEDMQDASDAARRPRESVPSREFAQDEKLPYSALKTPDERAIADEMRRVAQEKGFTPGNIYEDFSGVSEVLRRRNFGNDFGYDGAMTADEWSLARKIDGYVSERSNVPTEDVIRTLVQEDRIPVSLGRATTLYYQYLAQMSQADRYGPADAAMTVGQSRASYRRAVTKFAPLSNEVKRSLDEQLKSAGVTPESIEKKLPTLTSVTVKGRFWGTQSGYVGKVQVTDPELGVFIDEVAVTPLGNKYILEFIDHSFPYDVSNGYFDLNVPSSRVVMRIDMDKAPSGRRQMQVLDSRNAVFMEILPEKARSLVDMVVEALQKAQAYPNIQVDDQAGQSDAAMSDGRLTYNELTPAERARADGLRRAAQEEGFTPGNIYEDFSGLRQQMQREAVEGSWDRAMTADQAKARVKEILASNTELQGRRKLAAVREGGEAIARITAEGLVRRAVYQPLGNFSGPTAREDYMKALAERIDFKIEEEGGFYWATFSSVDQPRQIDYRQTRPQTTRERLEGDPRVIVPGNLAAWADAAMTADELFGIELKVESHAGVSAKAPQYDQYALGYAGIAANGFFASLSNRSDSKKWLDNVVLQGIIRRQFDTIAEKVAQHLKIADVEDPQLLAAALAQHVGYLVGVLSRANGVPKADVRSALEADVRSALQAYFDSNGDVTQLKKLSFITDDFLKANGWMFFGELKADGQWSYWGFGSLSAALNMPGVYALKAVKDFAYQLQALQEGSTYDLVDNFVKASPDEKAKWLQGEGEFRMVALAQFSARAAQLGWVVSKIGQGIVEARKGKASSVSRWQAPLMTTFDKMAEANGWVEVAKDLDQISAAWRHWIKTPVLPDDGYEAYLAGFSKLGTKDYPLSREGYNAADAAMTAKEVAFRAVDALKDLYQNGTPGVPYTFPSDLQDVTNLSPENIRTIFLREAQAQGNYALTQRAEYARTKMEQFRFDAEQNEQLADGLIKAAKAIQDALDAAMTAEQRVQAQEFADMVGPLDLVVPSTLRRAEESGPEAAAGEVKRAEAVARGQLSDFIVAKKVAPVMDLLVFQSRHNTDTSEGGVETLVFTVSVKPGLSGDLQARAKEFADMVGPLDLVVPSTLRRAEESGPEAAAGEVKRAEAVARGQLSDFIVAKKVAPVMDLLVFQSRHNTDTTGGGVETLTFAVYVKSDAAMGKADIQGGIDFNEQYMKMNIKRDGNGVPLPVGQQDLENIRIDGLVPQILNIQPVMSLPILSDAGDPAPSSA